VLETDGTNLMSVLGVDYIDSSRTISNDIVEVLFRSVLKVYVHRCPELQNVIVLMGLM
jgi:DNA-directed RNA polymerase II subunit RPB1